MVHGPLSNCVYAYDPARLVTVDCTNKVLYLDALRDLWRLWHLPKPTVNCGPPRGTLQKPYQPRPEHEASVLFSICLRAGERYRTHHFLDELFEAYRTFPPEQLFSLGWIAEQVIDFDGAVESELALTPFTWRRYLAASSQGYCGIGEIQWPQP